MSDEPAPAGSSGAEPMRPPPGRAGRARERPLVLLLDDCSDMRLLFRLALARRFDVDVVDAANGDEALELARRVRPDALVLDVMVPGIHGSEVASTLRREGYTQPILGTSALDARLFREGPFDRYAGYDEMPSALVGWVAEVFGLELNDPAQRSPA